MQDRSPSDVIKPEVRGLSAYTLKHVKADVKLDQNENPYELAAGPQGGSRSSCACRPWGRYPEFVPHSDHSRSVEIHGMDRGRDSGRQRFERTDSGRSVGDAGSGRKAVIPQPTFTLYKLIVDGL